MGAHVLSAGSGCTYLTSQVAANDLTGISPGGLGAYYAERGEAPGQWLGAGLAGLGITRGDQVREAQMVSLFGEGRHPDAAAITAELMTEGVGLDAVDAATALGTPFKLNPAANEFTRQVAILASEWNVANGHPACAAVPSYVKSRIRTAVGGAMFAKAYGREAADAQELSGFIATQSRLASRTVAGYDLTFSPVKSVSALWALAPPSIAAEIEAAHHAAVGDTIGWLERHAAYTRLGRNGVRQVETRGLVAAAFTHRDSRAGDPDLHTHVAVSNKVQTLDGRWRALDGRVLFKATVAASERYNTRLEAELRARLGFQFTERAGTTPGKRPVREIVGVDDGLLRLWSSRRTAIDIRRAAMTASFQAEHGRPPTPVEAIELAQRATLETRQAKHAPRSESEQRQAWRTQAIAAIGATAIDGIFRGVASHESRTRAVPDARHIEAMAVSVITSVQASRATWQRWHVTAEAQRQLRRLELLPGQIDATLDRVVDIALEKCCIALGDADPADEFATEELCRSDGSSVYAVAGAQLYTSRAIVDAEQALLAAAALRDGARVHETTVELALLETAANGITLTPAQDDMVRTLATSGARLQLALAPAGTGKTTAMRVLARAWAEEGGNIIALAPSAAAAAVLGDAVGAPAETIAKLLHDLDPGPSASAATIGRRTLVLIDEAGMAGTTDLARIAARVLDRGASIRLIGDDRQLAAIGAGGILRDLAEEVGAVRLDTALRFSDPAEADATLALRTGDTSAVEFYLDRHRIQVGDEDTALDSAYRAWAADRAAGLESLLLAPTREQVTALNSRARADRIAGQDHSRRREVRLADGTAASVGDVILTRHNDRRLVITATDWVKNGDRFTVESVGQDGSIEAKHHETRRRVTLPANYVADYVALGYACTIHTAQGRTADTSHTVLDGHEDRQQLYVATTRGRRANHVHVALPGAADEHAPIRRDTLIPPTAVDLLTRVIERDGAQRSATTELRELTDPARQLRHAVAAYSDALAAMPAMAATSSTDPPLPWLPAIPTPTTPDRRGHYLAIRAEQIRELATDVVVLAIKRPSGDGLRHLALIHRRDSTLLADLATWAAVHGIHTDPDQLTPTEVEFRAGLARRLQRAQGTTANPFAGPTRAHAHSRSTATEPRELDRSHERPGMGP